jgi:hypothetical protein
VTCKTAERVVAVEGSQRNSSEGCTIADNGRTKRASVKMLVLVFHAPRVEHGSLRWASVACPSADVWIQLRWLTVRTPDGSKARVLRLRVPLAST